MAHRRLRKAVRDTLNGKLLRPRLAGPIGEQNRYGQILLVLVPLAVSRIRAERRLALQSLAAVLERRAFGRPQDRFSRARCRHGAGRSRTCRPRGRRPPRRSCRSGARSFDRRPAPLRYPPCLSSVCRMHQHTASCAERVQGGHLQRPTTSFPRPASRWRNEGLNLARPSYSRTSSIAFAAASCILGST